MFLQPYAEDLIAWCERNPVKCEVACYKKVKPSGKIIERLGQLHPLLPNLYQDTNGILISWEALHQNDVSGIFKIHPIEECVELAESETKRINEWSDEDILKVGHDKKWWKSKISHYRSMVQFYDEGNGDFIAISKLDSCIYFVFHDWMDWVSEEPPIIKLADSLD